MSTVFIIRNQHGHYLNRQGEWVDAREAQSLYRTVHRDEAVNSVFEASARDVTIRAEAISCALDARGVPRLDTAASHRPSTAEPDAAPASQPSPDEASSTDPTEQDTTVLERPQSAVEIDPNN